jgi:two-component system nitrate/nitrite response regulator NarP
MKRSTADRPADNPEPIEVAIADKNPLVLAGLKQLIAEDDRFRLVVTATDGDRFLDALDRLPFDVGVIGWVMPYRNGRAVLNALRQKPDAPRIVVYTGGDDPGTPGEAMALGAAAFCSKSEPPEHLLDTMAAVAAGRMVFPFIDVRALNRDPIGHLTGRERELLAALASGRTNAQLARDLGVSVNTVKFHLKNLYEKLSVRNRAQAVALHLSERPARE